MEKVVWFRDIKEGTKLEALDDMLPCWGKGELVIVEYDRHMNNLCIMCNNMENGRKQHHVLTDFRCDEGHLHQFAPIVEH